MLRCLILSITDTAWQARSSSDVVVVVVVVVVVIIVFVVVLNVDVVD